MTSHSSPQLDDIRFRKWVFVTEPDGRNTFNTGITPDYPQAFAARGLDLKALDPAEAARRIAAAEIRSELVAAVDDWAAVRGGCDGTGPIVGDRPSCRSGGVVGPAAQPGRARRQDEDRAGWLRMPTRQLPPLRLSAYWRP